MNMVTLRIDTIYGDGCPLLVLSMLFLLTWNNGRTFMIEQ
jgi:hypothetical protein